MAHRLTCPHCDTSYTDMRCGVDIEKLTQTHGSAIVVCMVCARAFRVEPHEVHTPSTVTVSRWLRRKTTTPGDTSIAVSTVDVT